MKKYFGILLFALMMCAALSSCEYIDSQHNHKYSKTWSHDETMHWRVATCGHSDLETNRGAHTWDSGKETVSPTEESEGVFTYSCTVCKREVHSDIARLPHTHKFNTDEWEYNDGYHWKRATCEHTNETTTALKHNFLSNVCVDCDYMKDSEDLAFYLLPNNTYEVRGQGANRDSALVIPASYNGKPVTSIGEGAFSNNEIITRVSIPETVTTINNRAFYACINLGEVIWRGTPTVKTIGDFAFFKCEKTLKSFTIPASVTSFGSGVLHTCVFLEEIIVEEGNQNYKSIDGNLYTIDGKKMIQYAIGRAESAFEVPETVTELGYGVFATSDTLKSVVFPEGCTITRIPDDAFYYCRFLESVNIPSNVDYIGYQAFSHCLALKSIDIPVGVTNIGDYGFNMCNALEQITIPAAVRTIGAYAFSNCLKFTRLDIPEGVQRLGNNFAEGCVALTEITIPSTVTSYGSNMFYGSSSLQKVTVSENNTKLSDIDGNVYTKDQKTIIYYCVAKTEESFTVPSSVKTIGISAFYAADNLKTLVIPDSVTTIRDRAFLNCDNLTSISLPDTVKTIGDEAFSGCINLTSVTIPASVTVLEKSLFHHCNSLESITIPTAVTKIEKEVFATLPKLKNIYFANTEGWSCFALLDDSIEFSVTFTPEEISDSELMAKYLCKETIYYGAEWTRTAS